MFKNLFKKTSIFLLASAFLLGCNCGGGNNNKLFATFMGMGSPTVSNIDEAVTKFKNEKKDCQELQGAHTHLVELHGKLKNEWASMNKELESMKDMETKNDHQNKMNNHKTQITELESLKAEIENLQNQYCTQVAK
jgi:hypothetical protein